MKNFFGFCLLLLSFSLKAQTYETGKIIDSIAVPETTVENFAMYLPSSFDSSAISPIVFIFDPSGRGKNGIKPFIEASEKYGHILICSNNAKNGPYNLNFDFAQHLFDHAFSIFNIDEKQVYLAGFSGGSRLASAIASLTNGFTGVIACGAGFANAPSLVPTNQEYFYAGICGNRDMNYTEMIGVKAYLDKANFKNTLITFNGGHRWPPSKQILKAFDWLRLEGHKKEVLTLDEKEIQDLYLQHYNEAKDAENNVELLAAVEGYERIIATYNSYYQLDSIKNISNTIQKRKAYKQAIKSLILGFEKENEFSFLFYNRFNADYENIEKVKMDWWKKELKKLEETNRKDDLELEKMIDRVKSKLAITIYSINNSQSKKQKAFCDNLLRLIYPDYNTN